MCTRGITMPSSIAILRRSTFTRSRRSPPRSACTRSISSTPSSRLSGSTAIPAARVSGILRRLPRLASSFFSLWGSATSLADGCRRRTRLPPTMRNGSFGRPGTECEDHDDHAGITHDAAKARESWVTTSVTEVVVGCRTRHDDARRERQRQGRDLGDRAVTDGEEAVGIDRLAAARWRSKIPIASPPTRLTSVITVAAIDRRARTSKHRPSLRRNRLRRRSRDGVGAPRARRSRPTSDPHRSPSAYPASRPA